MADVPNRLDLISAPWLSEHLGASVTALSLEPMPGIVGTLGDVGIFTLGFDGHSDLPTEYVGKLPLDNDTARMYNAIMNYYPREGGWYREFSEESPFRAPRAFVNTQGDDPNNTFLLIEKVAVDEAGDILVGTTYERHEAIVRSLAELHGRFWGRESLRQYDWLYDWLNPNLAQAAGIMQMVWGIYHDMHPDKFPADLKSLLERTWVNDTARWLAICDDRPFTLCHGDYQLDNILFQGDDHIVIDYQGCMRSYPGFDIGWYFSSSLPGDQAEYEPELMNVYRSTLATSGGPSLTSDELLFQCALFSLYSATGQTMPGLQDTTPFGDKGERMRRRFDRFLDGSIEAALRWDTVGRIGPLV
jgi:thiamine kinase-like enzyme